MENNIKISVEVSSWLAVTRIVEETIEDVLKVRYDEQKEEM